MSPRDHSPLVGSNIQDICHQMQRTNTKHPLLLSLDKWDSLHVQERIISDKNAGYLSVGNEYVLFSSIYSAILLIRDNTVHNTQQPISRAIQDVYPDRY